MLPAPELVEAQAIEMDGKANVALELKRGTLTERVVRGEEAAESHACHFVAPRKASRWVVRTL